jgi:putative hemin transport protein
MSPPSTPEPSATSCDTLRGQLGDLIDTGQRPRDAATQLAVSEGEVLALLAGDPAHRVQATRLRASWKEMLQSLGGCGPLLALTRNGAASCEQVGRFSHVRERGGSAVAKGDRLHLRLFLDRWHAAFAVRDTQDPEAIRLQFFDRGGNEVHQVRAWQGTDRAALLRVIDRFSWPAFATPFRGGAATRNACRPLFAAADPGGAPPVAAAPGRQRVAWRAAPVALCDLLRAVSQAGLRVAIAVGSLGCQQRHSGPLRHLQPLQVQQTSWLHVLDEGFNLHLREDRIRELQVVETATPQGIVTSVLAVGTGGEQIVTLTGERGASGGQHALWRRLLATWRMETDGTDGDLVLA